jgi:hypothetical protein
VLADPNRGSYSDIAITPLLDNENESLDLFHATRGGEAALARKHRDDAIRAGAHGDHVPVVPAQQSAPMELPKVDRPAI